MEKSVTSQKTHSFHTAAYCKARKRLPLELIQNITRKLGQTLHENSQEDWKWCGRSVKLIDATTVSMPDTKMNQESFPQNRAQKEGLGFPLARLSVLISLSSGALLNAGIGDYRTSEHRLFLELIKNLSPGDVLVGDRLYACYFIVALLQRMGIDCVFKMHASRKYNFKKGKYLGKDDHVALWHKPQKPAWLTQDIYDRMPKTLFVRELKKGTITLVTTLQDKVLYPKNKIIKLYLERWHIELDIRSIKTIMQMDILRCKTPAMIIKEIWVNLLAYNVIRTLMIEVANFKKTSPRKLSYKATLQGVRIYLTVHIYATRCERNQLYKQLLINLSKKKVGNRPNRIEPRVVKRRPKPLTLMIKPRHLLRAEIINARA